MPDWTCEIAPGDDIIDGMTHTDSNNSGSIADRFYATFPNAEPHHGFDGIDIPWSAPDGGEHHIIVTSDIEGEWLIGVYLDGAWMAGDEAAASVLVGSLDAAYDLVDAITELQPEGTDFGAWVVQWLADASADGRIAGEITEADVSEADHVRDIESLVAAVLVQIEDVDQATKIAILSRAMQAAVRSA